MAQKHTHANLKTGVRARLERTLERRQTDVERYSKPYLGEVQTAKLKIAQREVEGIKKHIASLRTKPKHNTHSRKKES